MHPTQESKEEEEEEEETQSRGHQRIFYTKFNCRT